MILTYDLSRSPPTYDFVGALLTMEMERIKHHADHIDIRIKPGPVGGFRRDNLPPFMIAERQAMLENIVFPMAWMLPSVRSVEMGESDTRIGHGTALIVRALKAGVRPLRAPKPEYYFWPIVPYVTITLREASYWTERNSDVPAWLKIAKWLDAKGFFPIIIRDTTKANEPMPYSEPYGAATDLRTRANLYAHASLNLFTNNGPAWFCAALGAPTLIWRMVAPSPATTEAFLARAGLPVGSQLPGMSIVWGEDPYPAIEEALR